MARAPGALSIQLDIHGNDCRRPSRLQPAAGADSHPEFTGLFSNIALDVGCLATESARYRHHRASPFMLCGVGHDNECRTVRSQQPQRVLSPSARLYNQRLRTEPGIERGSRGAPTVPRARQIHHA